MTRQGSALSAHPGFKLSDCRHCELLADGAQGRRLAVHRASIAARSDRLTRLLHVVGRMTDGKDPIMTNIATDPTAATTVELDAATHRLLGAEIGRVTWTVRRQ